MLTRIAIALACFVFADEATGDLKKMVGTWEATSYVTDGKKWDEKDLKRIKLTVHGVGENELVQGDREFHATYKLDETATPKAIDFTRTRGADKGKKRLGIYELKGDRLRFCVGPVGGERPKKFASEPGTGVWLEVWKRVK
ncbi:MAG: TIGR03067 domain-containing protein [Gemmataceae bacterium]